MLVWVVVVDWGCFVELVGEGVYSGFFCLVVCVCDFSVSGDFYFGYCL